MPLTHTFKTILSTIILLVAICILGACHSNKTEEIQALTNLEEIPTLMLTDLETTIHDSGIVKYKFMTPELIQFEKKDQPYIDFPKGLKVVIYKKTGEVDANIKANWAKFLKKEKLWELKNNVVATNQKGDVLNTEQLFWDQNKERIYNDLYTKITTKTEILTGVGFSSNQNLTEYTFRKPQGVFTIENQK